MSDASARFARGLEALLGADEAGLGVRLRLHYELMVTFASRIALTADVGPDEALGHVAEGLWAARHYRGPEVLDVGAGAGYPSIVVAMARPDLRVTLLERNRRRAAFLEYAAARLGMGSLRVRHAALADLGSEAERFATVSVRALPRMSSWLGSAVALVGAGGVALVFASLRTSEELLRAFPLPWQVAQLREPGTEQKVLLVAERSA